MKIVGLRKKVQKCDDDDSDNEDEILQNTSDDNSQSNEDSESSNESDESIENTQISPPVCKKSKKASGDSKSQRQLKR